MFTMDSWVFSLRQMSARKLVGLSSILLFVLSLAGCAATGGQTDFPVRLVDAFDEAIVTNQPTAVAPLEPIVWKGDALGEVKALHGVAALSLAGESLEGEATDSIPLLEIPFPGASEGNDLIHAVEVRMRASGGANLGVVFSGDEPTEESVAGLIAQTRESEKLAWEFRSPVVPGDSFRTYTLTKATAVFVTSLPRSKARYILLRPVDIKGARFEIESVRLISRREHLANIPSGISFQGFGDIFRECVVTRSPEELTFSIRFPGNPRLDLDLGTIEPGPLTFEVLAETGTGTESLLRKTLTTPERWEAASVDLSHLAGRSVKLILRTRAANPGSIGFWGAPVIRTRQSRVARNLPRGVILVVGDTLRRDHLNLYGYSRETAPHLTELAESGALFLDDQSQASWTKVSVSSILTSLYPRTHGIVDLPDRMPAEATTVAEAFRNAGFATWASSSVPFSGQLTNLHQGVEVLHERSSIPEEGSKTARPFVDRLIPWLKRNQDVPFFAFLHIFDPHSPFEPRRPYSELWNDPAGRKDFETALEKATKQIKLPFMRGMGLATREELEASGVDIDAFVKWEQGWYDGSIRGMDDEIARLREFLAGSGLLEDTVLVFMSDHGEEFLDHGRHWHGNTIYGEMTNVPLMISWPAGIKGGQRITQTVQSIDVVPTLLELAGIPIPDRAQGRSLVPLLQPDSSPQVVAALSERPVFSERLTIPSEDAGNPDSVDSYAIVWKGWKLIHNVKRPEGFPEIELFNHRKDPWTRENVAEQHPDVVAELKARLEQWMEETAAVKLKHGIDTDNLSPKELERLRGLGYIQ